MLTPPDADLVQRAAVLPGLATLLDPVAFATRLQAICPGVMMQDIATVYVRYKPATSCLVTYQVATAAAPDPIFIYGVAFRRDEAAKLAKAREKRYQTGPLGFGALVLQDLCLVLYSFPNDRRLKALRRVHDGAQRRQWLADWVPDQPALHQAYSTTLRYKPERRLVARLDSPQQQALLRLYAKEEFATAAANHNAIGAAAHFCTPQVVGIDRTNQALLMSWLPGRPLDQLLGSRQDIPSTLVATGSALASLHAQHPPLPLHYTPVTESATIHSAATAIAALVPPLGERATRLADRLAAVLSASPYQPVVIHGDFSADQVLVRAQAADTENPSAPIALLDWDRAGYGDPAADLGSFAANLYQRVRRGQLAERQVGPIMTALGQGYCAIAPKPVAPQRIELHTAARLLRLAPEAFRQRWATDWPTEITAILEKAEEISDHA